MKNKLNEYNLIEKCAEIAHEQWSGWMQYLFRKCNENEDGSVTIPKSAVERWKRQVNTSYDNLSNNEKESDRKEARKFISAFKEFVRVFGEKGMDKE